MWVLHLIHVIYVVAVSALAWIRRFKWKKPLPLSAHRSKVPGHVCLNLVASDEFNSEELEVALLECLRRVVGWCREVGIEVLTVYDRDGILVWCQESVRECISQVGISSEESCESEVEYPLTPPLSEPSSSRSQSPESAKLLAKLAVVTFKSASNVRLHKRRNVAVRRRQSKQHVPHDNDLTLHIVSRDSAKPAIAHVARSLLKNYVQDRTSARQTHPLSYEYQLSTPQLASVLQGGLPPPDLMVVHSLAPPQLVSQPLELCGFPPWQIMLTEFHYTHPEDLIESKPSPRNPILISETAFCRALDEYAGAQFRLGK
ncbi:hypothetical protein J3A83DRAFT_4188803 [Scleroderma citrinum]